MPDSVRWYIILMNCTLAIAPFVRMIAGPSPSRGAFIAKPAALLLVVWPVWFLSSVAGLSYNDSILRVVIVATALVGWGIAFLRKAIDRQWLLHLLAAEVIALVAFVGYLGFRGYTPELTGTEKPMDLAFLSSSARSTVMPPLDPWMSGERINYYYLGYLLHGSLARLTAVPTWVAFNLALATTFAMSMVAAFGVGYDLLRGRFSRSLAIAAGALAAFFVVISGNMLTPARLLRDWAGTVDAGWWNGIGWNASRVVEDTGSGLTETINEFPSFSFVLGDLHPHVMALPFTLVSLALAVGLLRTPRPPRGSEEGDVAEDVPAILNSIKSEPLWWLRLVAVGGIIGALYPLNSWDFPTFLGGAMLALFVARGWRKQTLAEAGVVAVAAVALWAPFWLSFVPFAGPGYEASGWVRNIPILNRIAETVAPYGGERTSLREFLTVFGMPWLIVTVFLCVIAWRERERAEPTQSGVSRYAILAGIVVIGLAMLLPAPVVLLAGAPLAAGIWILRRRMDEPDSPAVVAALFAAAASGLILVTEFYFIRDVFNGRLNTLFKVYYQAWTLLGIAAAVAVVLACRSLAAQTVGRVVAGASIAVMLAAGVSYPILSARAWTVWNGPREWTGLDGSQFVVADRPGDMAAILWLQENAKPGDVILESPGCSYQVNGGVPIGRMAAFTGVPNLIGWGGHEDQWRGGQPDLQAQIGIRQSDVAAIYADPTSPLVESYGVTLMVVGPFEREGWGECSVAGPFPNTTSPSFPGPGWTEVFSQDGTAIYRRDGT